MCDLLVGPLFIVFRGEGEGEEEQEGKHQELGDLTVEDVALAIAMESMKDIDG